LFIHCDATAMPRRRSSPCFIIGRARPLQRYG
jgi:hypothetical protein